MKNNKWYLELDVNDFMVYAAALESGDKATIKALQAKVTGKVAKPAAKATKVAKTAKKATKAAEVKAEPAEAEPEVIVTVTPVVEQPVAAKPSLTLAGINDEPRMPTIIIDPTVITINNDHYLLVSNRDYCYMADYPQPIGDYNNIGDDFGCASTILLYRYTDDPVDCPYKDDVIEHNIGGTWVPVNSGNHNVSDAIDMASADSLFRRMDSELRAA